MDICAGIVLYNPSMAKFRANILAIISQVKKVILIDNGSKNINEIEDYLRILDSSQINLIRNNENLGIGKALNQILDYSRSNGYEWFLTLDQDSVCKPGLVERYTSFLAEKKGRIGQLSCVIVDEKLGEIERKQYNETDYVEIESCITSGTLNNTMAVQEVGRFNEQFYIDGVDIEMSLRLRETGYLIIKLDYDGLNHSLGDGERIRVLGKTFSLTRHAPWRSYYMRRNFIFIARKYYSGGKRIKIIARQIGISIGTVLLEDQKVDRIRYCTKGIIDGFKM